MRTTLHFKGTELFNQSIQKLEYIKKLQERMQCNDGEDGLNDAGALAQSNTFQKMSTFFRQLMLF
jgi:hypothetical protein